MGVFGAGDDETVGCLDLILKCFDRLGTFQIGVKVRQLAYALVKRNFHILRRQKRGRLQKGFVGGDLPQTSRNRDDF